MLTREAKGKIIEELNGKFTSGLSMFVIDYSGLTVKDLEKIRKDLKVVDSEIRIVKNTLLRRASSDTVADQLTDLFTGSTAIGFSKGDSSASAKVFVDSAKTYEQFTIRGGVVEGKKVDAGEIERISKLPTKTELIAQFASLLNSPMSRFAYSLKNMQTKFLYLLQALKEKK